MHHHTFSALVLITALGLPAAATAAEHFGGPALAKNADRTVVLTADTKSVNIERGEIVTLVYMDKSFTWKFDTLGVPTFPVADIAPKDFGTGHVRLAVFPHRIFDAGG